MLKAIQVCFDNPDHNYNTSISGCSDDISITDYFYNTLFNVASYPEENFQRCIGYNWIIDGQFYKGRIAYSAKKIVYNVQVKTWNMAKKYTSTFNNVSTFENSSKGVYSLRLVKACRTKESIILRNKVASIAWKNRHIKEVQL